MSNETERCILYLLAAGMQIMGLPFLCLAFVFCPAACES